MLEQFSLLFSYLRMFYIQNHFCHHTAADSEAFDHNNLECIGDETTRMHMRLRLAGLIFDHQEFLREYLGVDESEALVLYKIVVSADLHYTEDDPALHWTVRLYNAQDVQVATMHVHGLDDSRELTIDAKVSYRDFHYEDEQSGTKMLCFRRALASTLVIRNTDRRRLWDVGELLGWKCAGCPEEVQSARRTSDASTVLAVPEMRVLAQVRAITDALLFEPYWGLRNVDLSMAELESVARLKEFLPRLDGLNQWRAAQALAACLCGEPVGQARYNILLRTLPAPSLRGRHRPSCVASQLSTPANANLKTPLFTIFLRSSTP
ncbi:hypothetical protein HYPSUDRAFT_207038 [Hypholoma sublateritium FD-334 SS-4]|uniref:Uncharacterized protein n=1 Tax=Hypholoma sublateritium (strain FD-334 SS-4) TaxID=945553 RepID=A0A0D2NIK0_HYPSF|nr:hypothetical protein HYPSUDRAFT_207038 [Hypholoma sublateritium FD-334 SS-4]